MSFDTFVKIDGIEGESTDSKHSGWIEATQYKAGASQNVSSTVSSAGGATTGRVDVKPFCIISDVTTIGGENQFPTESVSIDFGKIIVTYIKQKRQGGGPAGNISAGWDLQRNRKV